MNEYAAKIVSQYPERFGFFAFLPMPDLNASINEARYALDVLGADGVVLLGNARGKYFSQPEFHPLLEELNRRHTVRHHLRMALQETQQIHCCTLPQVPQERLSEPDLQPLCTDGPSPCPAKSI